MREQHYFSSTQNTPFVPKIITEILRGIHYEFQTASGVFSKNKVDYGTKVLVENMQVKENDKVLDLGCGIGVVGRVAATITQNKVTLVDVNKRAVKLAKINTEKILNVEVKLSDGFENLAEEMFDVILLNPPQTAGKEVCHRLIRESKEHLNLKGSLQIVARHNKGGEQLSKYMETVFSNMETIAKKGGYRVYVSVA